MLIEQVELITIYLLILPPLAFDVVCYYFFIAISSYGVYVVAACPKMAAPKYFLDLGVSLEYFLSCNTFYRLHNIFWTHYRYTLNQKMNVVFINSYLHEMNLVPLPYPYTNFLQALGNFFCENFSPVFCGAYDVV